MLWAGLPGIAGSSPARHNITSPLVTGLADSTGLARRDTSLADCATLIGLPAFLHAADITSRRRLGRISADDADGYHL